MDLSNQPELGHSQTPLATSFCASALNGRLPLEDSYDEEFVYTGRVDTLSEEETKAVLRTACHHNDFTILQKLQGDFAALYANENSVVLARNKLGTHPLYYSVHNDTLYYADTLRDIIAATPARLEPDIEAIGFYLLDCYAFTERTLYKNIFRVRPGHALLLKKNYQQSIPYCEREFYHSALETDIEEQFRSLLIESTAKRSIQHSSIGILLSGGIDSAAIARAASCTTPAQNLYTFSLRFNESMCDPGGPLDEVRRSIPAQHFDLWPDRDDSLLLDKDPARGAMQYSPNSYMFGAAYRRAAELGVPVVWTGLGGDNVFTANALYLTELLRTGNLSALRGEFPHYCSNTRDSLSLIATALIRPFVPDSLMKLCRRLVPRALPDWFGPALRNYALQTQIFDRYSAMRAERGDFATRSIYFRLLGWGGLQWSMEHEFEFARSFGLKPGWPLLDENLVKFSLSLPLEAFRYGGWGKRVLRDAMSSWFPEHICYSPRYVDYSVMAARVYKQQDYFNELWQNSRVVQEGIVNAHGLNHLLETAKKTGNFQTFLRLLHVERLLRKLL